MASKKTESAATSILDAVSTVHAALEPLTPEDRSRVLASVRALLEIPAGADETRRYMSGETSQHRAAERISSRPLGLVEVMKERKPVTIPGKIVLFAYYRERHEGLSRFSRDDLEPYFAKAHEPPPTHYSRDFVNAVKRGWLHEDGADSYITSKGIEEVEAGFPNERKWSTKAKKKAGSAAKSRKAATRKTARK